VDAGVCGEPLSQRQDHDRMNLLLCGVRAFTGSVGLVDLGLLYLLGCASAWQLQFFGFHHHHHIKIPHWRTRKASHATKKAYSI
jgi:hypothetical protein